MRVSLKRRELLRGGLIGAGAMMVSGPSLASEPLTYRLVPDPLAPLPPSVPATPAPAPVDAALLARAKAALERHAFVRNRDVIGIADFSRASREARFHVVDLLSGRVDSHLVSHGRGSDRAHSGWLEQFSNEVGSLATSNGAYATADFYHGKYGLSMKLHGLDWSNSNALERAIVVHQAWYAEPEMIAQHGKLGRSEGCFAFSRDSHFQIMRRLGNGRLIYADKLA